MLSARVSSVVRLLVSTAVASLVSTTAVAGVGGYMSQCYTGSGFRTDILCETKFAQATSKLDDQHSVLVTVRATGRYTQENGEKVLVGLSFTLSDPSNYFDPEAKLPLLVRVISAGYHRDPPTYFVTSTPVTISRPYGERYLTTTSELEITLHNSFGAEYVEQVSKVEVLVPGFPSVLVLNL